MERKIEFAPGEYYHVYVRGANRQPIFNDDKDKDRLLAALYTCNTSDTIHISDYWKSGLARILDLPKKDKLVDIGAWCFMPNHFHLLIREPENSKAGVVGISTFMQKFLTGYSMYFNKKNNRTGALFEKPFKAKHVGDDEYLRYLFAYIHLNPVKIIDPESWSGKKIKNPAKAKQFLDDYRYSSYGYYAGEKSEQDKIIQPEVFPDYFSNSENDFNSFIEDWLNFDEDEPTVKGRP